MPADSCIRTLQAESTPFALIHDCRQVQYSSMDLGLPFVDWGRTVARLGAIRRVAFVVGDVGSVALMTLNGMLWMSPVQPAKIFAQLDEAERWISSTPQR